FISTLYLLFFFFFTVLPSPRSTLFPTRRSSDLLPLTCPAQDDRIRLRVLRDGFQGALLLGDFRPGDGLVLLVRRAQQNQAWRCRDRKSTRLNSSHDQISYAVFCLKKKKNTKYTK